MSSLSIALTSIILSFLVFFWGLADKKPSASTLGLFWPDGPVIPHTIKISN